MARPHPETISPTAHYTGYVWLAHGLSNAAFATLPGRAMYQALRPANLAAGFAGLPTLEGMLLARHRLIDLRLAEAIDSGEVSQVIEVACGLSPRGWRFRTRYGDRLTYIEADLPGMLENKRRILEKLGGETEGHRTAEINALADDGPTSIAALCETLDPARGTAIITEGLINYFDLETVVGIWSRFQRALALFPTGTYITDIMTSGDNNGALVNGAMKIISTFVRGAVHLHFETPQAVEDKLDTLGFDAAVLSPNDYAAELPGIERAGAAHVRIVEAIAR